MLALVAGIAAAAPPSGDSVALLLFDADKRLELYGQPVASQLAVALSSAGVTVVVVGPDATIPTDARLILDGKITDEGGVTVTLGLRDRFGTTVKGFPIKATRPALTEIDEVTAELAKELVPMVQKELTKKPATDKHPLPHPDALSPILVTEHATVGPGEPLRAALAPEVDAWAHQHKREPRPGKIVKDPNLLVTNENAELGITFEVVRYEHVAGKVPMVRARVRVAIASAKEVLFDRVIVTDTIVGDAKMSDDDLAKRAAREVLAILAPHIKKAVPTW